MAGTADIGIRVFLDNAASAGLGQINGQLVQMVDVLQRASGGLNITRGQLMAMAVVAGAGVAFFAFAMAIKASYDAAEQLQSIMFSISIATKNTMDATMAYTPALMNLAASSIYTSAQIGAGIVIMGRSGFTLDDILGKTNHMAQAAINLGEATRSTALQGFTILSQVMQAYNAKADQATHYSDLLQFAFEHQTGTISQLQSAFANLTPIAAQLHIPFDQLVAAIDVVGPAMGSTTKAGTALRYAISSMASPTAAATKEMASLGIITVSQTTPAVAAFGESLVASGAASADFVKKNANSVVGLQNMFAAAQAAGQIPLDQSFSDWAYQSGLMSSQFFDAKGHALDLTGMLDVLAAHLKGLKGDALAAAEKAIFSVRGGQGIQDLLQNMGKYDGLMKTLTATNDNAGTSQRKASELMQTAAAAAQALSSSVTDLEAAIGFAMLPVMTQIDTALNNFISMIRAAVQGTGPSIAIFLALGASLSAVALVVGIVGLVIAGIGTSLAIFVGIMLGSAVGIIALSAGIAMLVGWLMTAHGVMNNVVNILRGLGAALLVVGGIAAGVLLAPMVVALAGMIPTALLATASFIGLSVAMVRTSVQAAITTARLIIMNIGGIMGMIPTILAMTAAWIADASAMLIANAPMVLLVALIAAIVVGIGLLIAHLVQTGALLNFFRAAWAAIGPPIMEAGNAIKGAFMQALQQLAPVWAQLVASFNSARPALMFLGAIIGGVLVAALILAVGIIIGFVMALSRIIIMVIQVATAIAQVVMGIIMIFTGLFTVINGLVHGNGAMIQAGFGQMGQGVLNVFEGMWNAVKAVFVGAFSAIWAFVAGFIQIVVGLFHGLSSTLVGHSIIPDMMNAIIGVFTGAFNLIRSIVMAGINAIVAVFHMMQSLVTTAVNFAMSVVRALFTGGIGAAAAVVQNGVSQIIAHFMNMPGPIGNIARTIITLMFGFSNGVASVAGTIGGAVMRIVGVFQSMAAGIGGAISTAVGWVNNLVGAISHIPSIGGGLHIPGFAQGGIVTSPTLAMVGEGGEPEMILPLSQYQAAMQGAANSARQGGGSGGSTIVNNFIVDGKVVATSVMNTLTGQLQMNGMGRRLN